MKDRVNIEVFIETVKYILSSPPHEKEDWTPELLQELQKFQDEVCKRQTDGKPD